MMRLSIALALAVGTTLVGAGPLDECNSGDERIVALEAWAEPIAIGREKCSDVVDRGLAVGLSIAVVCEGELVWSEGFGLADREAGLSVTARTRFGIGSISKALTMAAVAASERAGGMSLDAPLSQYDPSLPEWFDHITARHIACHVSGLDDAFDRAHRGTAERFSLEDASREIASESPASPVGTVTRYTTGPFTVIGHALALAEGRPYESVMADRVLKPAGMIATMPQDPRAADPCRAAFYNGDRGGPYSLAAPYDPAYKLPGAGYLSTAADIARFGDALVSGRIVGPEAVRDLLTPATLSDGVVTEFCCGFRVGTLDDGTPVIHQPGGGIGISAWLVVVPSERLSMALLANNPTAPTAGRTAESVLSAFRLARAARDGAGATPAPPGG